MSLRPTLSFEFFPPKGEPPHQSFWQVIDDLAPLNPAFMTVTYGAGGSTRDWTIDTACKIQARTGISTAAHLTCINTMKDGIAVIADRLWDSGIKHIIALRGDIPKEDAPLNYGDPNYYHYANQLVEGLKARHDFEISVAAYPEKHPEASDLESDLAYLKQKCAAGADRAITQFFFDNTAFYRFRDRAVRAGITMPIIPGLLPIQDFARMLRIAGVCEARVPPWLHDRFAGLTPEDAALTGGDFLAEQARDLIDNGVEHLHFYTLNRADLTIAACKACGLAV